MTVLAYPGYKPSKVEWLAHIPQHWDLARIKETTYLKGRVGWKGLTSDEFLDSGYAHLVTGTDFRSKFIDWSDCYCVDRERYQDDPFIQLQNGDLLITKDGTIGKLAIVSEMRQPACLNSGIFLIRPLHSYTTEYMYWVLSSPEFAHFCDLVSYGSTIQHLYQKVFENFAFPLPPLPEQTAIAAFLDRETRKIDSLVEEQKRLIELLKEKRQAVISHAVTKGLNPDVPMKDPGIEWLGHVPEHWTVGRLKHFASIRGRIGFRGYTVDDLVGEGEGALALGGANLLVDGKLSLEKPTYLSWTKFQESPEIKVEKGDLLIGQRGTCGRVVLVDRDIGPATINPSLVLLKNLKALSNFSCYFLNGDLIQRTFDSYLSKTAIPMLSQEQIGNVPFVLPPLEEQSKIVKFLDREAEQIDALVSQAEAAARLLNERRSALISAAVTGKIDVRGLADIQEAAE